MTENWSNPTDINRLPVIVPLKIRSSTSLACKPPYFLGFLNKIKPKINRLTDAKTCSIPKKQT